MLVFSPLVGDPVSETLTLKAAKKHHFPLGVLQDLSRVTRSLSNLQQVLEQFQDEKQAMVREHS